MIGGEDAETKARTQDAQKGFSLSFDNDLWEAGFTEVPNYFLQARELSVDVRFACVCILAHIRDRKAEVDEQEGTFIGLESLAGKYGRSSRWWWQQTKELTDRGILRRQRRGFGQTVRHKFVTDHTQWNLEAIPSARAGELPRLLEWRAGQEQSPPPSSHVSAKMASSQTRAKMDSFADTCESFSQTRARRDSQTRARHIKDEEDAVRKKIQSEQDAVLCAASAAPPSPQTKDEQMSGTNLPTAASPEAAVPAQQRGARGRARKMTDEEKAAVEKALARFNEKLRPIVDDEYGRFMRETLQGIRGFGIEHFLATIDLLSTNPRFVDDPQVTPLLVTKTVPIWEDNGKPRSWRALEETKKRRMQNGRQ